MGPKTMGGAGNKSAQDYVAGLWLRLAGENAVRAQLKEDGYKAGRITQLIKATRPAEGQAGPAAAAAAALPKGMARPAAAEEVVVSRKKPAASSSAFAPRGSEATGDKTVQTMFKESFFSPKGRYLSNPLQVDGSDSEVSISEDEAAC